VLRYPPNDRIVLVSAAGEDERAGERVGHLARRSEDLENEDF
jgi:hypothetical protein